MIINFNLCNLSQKFLSYKDSIQRYVIAYLRSIQHSLNPFTFKAFISVAAICPSLSYLSIFSLSSIYLHSRNNFPWYMGLGEIQQKLHMSLYPYIYTHTHIFPYVYIPIYILFPHISIYDNFMYAVYTLSIFAAQMLNKVIIPKFQRFFSINSARHSFSCFATQEW